MSLLRQLRITRNDARVLLADYAVAVPSSAVLLTGLALWKGQGGAAAIVTFWVALLVYLPVRLLFPLVRWHSTTFVFADDTITVTWGVIRRKSRTAPWGAIASMDLHAGLLYRLLGLRQVTLTQTSLYADSIRLRAIRSADALVIQQEVERGEVATEEESSGPHVLYEASANELAVMSVVYGQFTIVLPAVLLPLWSFMENAGWSTWLLSALMQLPTALLVTIVIVVGGAVGVAGTFVKYQGFSVRSLPGGALRLRFGAVEKRERVIDPRTIEGVVVRRNLVEQLLGRCRLAVLSIDSSDSLESNVVLPSMPDTVVRSIMHDHFREFVGRNAVLPDARARFAPRWAAFLLCFGPPVALFAFVSSHGLTPVVAMMMAFAFFLVLGGAGRLMTSRIDFIDEGLIRHRRRVLTERDAHFRARAVHSFTVSRTRRGRILWLEAHAYVGGARTIPTLVASEATVSGLQEGVRQQKQSVAMALKGRQP